MAASRLSCTCARALRPVASTSRLPTLTTLPTTSPSPSLSRSLHSSPHRTSDIPPSNPLPWFVDPSSLPPAPSPHSAPLATSPLPLPPPDHLPEALHPLWNHLSVSPFLNKEAVRFIDARRLDGGEAWVEWVVVAQLRQGREGGLRGAIEGVRRFLSENPLALSPAETDLPFAPAHPTVTGLPSPPSRHARSRAMKQAGKGPGMAAGEQASGWAMLDAGDVVVHVMTEDARAQWGIEEIWDEKEKELAALEAKLARQDRREQ